MIAFGQRELINERPRKTERAGRGSNKITEENPGKVVLAKRHTRYNERLVSMACGDSHSKTRWVVSVSCSIDTVKPWVTTKTVTEPVGQFACLDRRGQGSSACVRVIDMNLLKVSARGMG